MSEPTNRDKTEPPGLGPAFTTVLALATWPFASLYVGNRTSGLDVPRLFAWWAVVGTFALLPVLIAARFGRQVARRTAVLVGAFLYLFFSSRPIRSLGAQLGMPMDRPEWIWVVGAGIGLVPLVILSRKSWAQLYLSLVAPALLLVPVWQIVSGPSTQGDDSATHVASSAGGLELRPNIYYFIVDGYAASDFVLTKTGRDISTFLEGLERRGFTISRDARSNYPVTHLSVSSTLELGYTFEGSTEPAPAPYFAKIRGDNATVGLLGENGYAYVHAYSGFWAGIRCSGREDACIGEEGATDETTWAILSLTPLSDVIVDRGVIEAIARASDPVYVVDELRDRDVSVPHFLLAHILAPHPPLFWDDECNVLDVPVDLEAWGEGTEYGEMIECLNIKLTEAVGEILETDPDPVIIIQADHGPRFDVDWNQPLGARLDADHLFSIISAIRLPDACRETTPIPQDLTPVNTFRLVLSCLSREPMDLLPNRTFPLLRPR